MRIFDKEACFKRAKNMFDKGDDLLLHYVSLELRFCIEAITYDKLRLYAKRLPQDVLEIWQPPQALRALLEFEPYVDEDFTLTISPESEPGVPTGNWTTLGEHRTFKLSWLRKYYNKIGSFLHVPTPRTKYEMERAEHDPGRLRGHLKEIIETLEPIIESSFDASLATVVEFQCPECGDHIICNRDGLKRRRKTICLNPNCAAEFAAKEDETGRFKFQIIATPFQCTGCGFKNFIENRKIAIGLHFKCERCGQEHEIHSRNWGYCSVKQLIKESS